MRRSIAAAEPRPARRRFGGWMPMVGLATLAIIAGDCGKKGPPLPPLVRLPSAPGEIKADRRGTVVDVRFLLPSANSDGSRPANIQRVDVYALTAAEPASENAVMKSGARIGSVDVKSPRDPNVTVDPDEPDSDIEPLEGPGLDQGAAAHVRELLTSAMVAGPDAVTRTYVGVGITTRGRRGLLSQPVTVSLAPPPVTPGKPAIMYDETTVTVNWEAAAAGGDGRLAYAVYDVSAPPADPAPSAVRTRDADARLNADLLDVTTYVDQRIAWNVERCYVVRAVTVVNGLAVEGDASPPACTILKDTFAPPAPVGVTAVASSGSINLIWTPSPATDLAGYRVLRAEAPSTALKTITTDLLSQTTYSDMVQPGGRYTYAVQAVDSAGNVSPASAPVDETAR